MIMFYGRLEAESFSNDLRLPDITEDVADRTWI
jgi:hypothetical protein